MSAPYLVTFEVVITVMPILVVIVGGTWFLLLADGPRRQDQSGQPGDTGRTTSPPPAVWADGPTSFPPISFDFPQNSSQGPSTAFPPHPFTPLPQPTFGETWTGTRGGSNWTTAPGFADLLHPADRPRPIGGSYREPSNNNDYPFGGPRPIPPQMQQPDSMPASFTPMAIRNLARLFEAWTLNPPPPPPVDHPERPPSPLQHGGRQPEVRQNSPIIWPRPPTPPRAPSPSSLQAIVPVDQMYASDSASSSGSSRPASPLRRVHSWTDDDDDHFA